MLWGAAMVALIATPFWVLLLPRRPAYDPARIAERYGLFTIIVLGESVVVTVAGLDTGSSFGALLVAVLGFVIAATVWWVYFDRFQAMPGGGRTARFIWAQVHLLIFLGIAAAAVGIEFAVEAAASGQRLELADSLPLGVGLAAYLVAMAAIRWATRGGDWVVLARFLVAAAVLVLAIVAGGLGPLAFTASVTALFAGEAAIELRRAPPGGDQPERVLPFGLAP